MHNIESYIHLNFAVKERVPESQSQIWSMLFQFVVTHVALTVVEKELTL